jgi:hypothetical protein
MAERDNGDHQADDDAQSHQDLLTGAGSVDAG